MVKIFMLSFSFLFFARDPRLFHGSMLHSSIQAAHGGRGD